MGSSTAHSLLPDGAFARAPAVDYARFQMLLRMHSGVRGPALQDHDAPVGDLYLPNGGVFSVTNDMRDGALVEIATVGVGGMLGIGTPPRPFMTYWLCTRRPTSCRSWGIRPATRYEVIRAHFQRLRL